MLPDLATKLVYWQHWLWVNLCWKRRVLSLSTVSKMVICFSRSCMTEEIPCDVLKVSHWPLNWRMSVYYCLNNVITVSSWTTLQSAQSDWRISTMQTLLFHWRYLQSDWFAKTVAYLYAFPLSNLKSISPSPPYSSDIISSSLSVSLFKLLPRSTSTLHRCSSPPV